VAVSPARRISPLFASICACALVALLVYCYWFGISEMLDQWNHDEDMGHILLVPLIAGWVAWRDRRNWLDRNLRPTWWGFAPLALAALLGQLAIAGAGKFASCVALLCAVVSVILILGGVRALRALTFPLLLLLFMLPKLAIVYNQFTLPLQMLATRLAEFTLSAGGMHVVRTGNILQLPNFAVSVVEACSGVRYLLSLAFFGVVYADFAGSGAWMKLATLAAMVPLAILANALRVTSTALLGTVNPQWAEGPAHIACGWVIFVAAMAAAVALHWVARKVARA
jgi:exosortase